MLKLKYIYFRIIRTINVGICIIRSIWNGFVNILLFTKNTIDTIGHGIVRFIDVTIQFLKYFYIFSCSMLMITGFIGHILGFGKPAINLIVVGGLGFAILIVTACIAIGLMHTPYDNY